MDLFRPYKPKILLISPSRLTPSWIATTLQEAYRVEIVEPDEESLDRVGADMLMLDVSLADKGGYALCKRLKREALPRDLPVVFIAEDKDFHDEALSIALGAMDHFYLPMSRRIFQSRVRAHFAIANAADTLLANNGFLKIEIAERIRQEAVMQDVAIMAMATLAETRDLDTGNHLRRTQNYVRLLATYLQPNQRFSRFLTDEIIELLYKCAPLHDIGKVGIPDRILLKPGRYEPHEFEIMKTHPTLGRDALKKAYSETGQLIPLIEVAIDLVYSHHEKWDGSGYPQGLAGDAIPISARLMALADVYDALISARIYKTGMSHDSAQDIIVGLKGVQFDPDVVDAFLALSAEFQSIARTYSDSQSDLQAKADLLQKTLCTT